MFSMMPLPPPPPPLPLFLSPSPLPPPSPSQGNDDVITCWHKDNEFSIHNGHNKPDDHMFVMDKDTSYQGDSADEVVLNRNHTRIIDGTFHCK